VRYADPSGVDVATIDDTDIRVWAQVDRTAVPAAYGQIDSNPSQVGN
jgi:hypothetical protein